jgi:hypothetical protein
MPDMNLPLHRRIEKKAVDQPIEGRFQQPFACDTQWAKTLYYVHLIKNIDKFKNDY